MKQKSKVWCVRSLYITLQAHTLWRVHTLLFRVVFIVAPCRQEVQVFYWGHFMGVQLRDTALTTIHMVHGGSLMVICKYSVQWNSSWIYKDYIPFNAQQDIYEYHYLGVQVSEDLEVWISDFLHTHCCMHVATRAHITQCACSYIIPRPLPDFTSQPWIFLHGCGFFSTAVR